MKKIVFLCATLLALIATMVCLPSFAEEFTADTSTVESLPAVTETETVTVTQGVAEWITEHFSDIVSAVTGTALIILTVAFKKVLLPTVAKAIQAVAKRSEESEGKFADGTKTAVSLLENCGKRLEVCYETLDKATVEMQKKIVAQNKAYQLQTDLINYLVMNLRIPNDLKAEIAERSAAVKNAIEEAEKAG